MDKIENHFNYNPWLRGIYDDARNIAASDPGAVLGDGLSELDLHLIAETLRCGDYEGAHHGYAGVLINYEANAVPEAYFKFLYIIGGFSCRSVQLYHLGNKYLGNSGFPDGRVANVGGLSVREKVITGTSSWRWATVEKCYAVQLTLGKCDHGEYVYDRRYDSYSLVGFEQTTPFNNCGNMLSHAMYRALENIKDNWMPSAPEVTEVLEAAAVSEEPATVQIEKKKRKKENKE